MAFTNCTSPSFCDGCHNTFRQTRRGIPWEAQAGTPPYLDAKLAQVGACLTQLGYRRDPITLHTGSVLRHACCHSMRRTGASKDSEAHHIYVRAHACMASRAGGLDAHLAALAIGARSWCRCGLWFRRPAGTGRRSQWCCVQAGSGWCTPSRMLH